MLYGNLIFCFISLTSEHGDGIIYFSLNAGNVIKKLHFSFFYTICIDVIASKASVQGTNDDHQKMLNKILFLKKNVKTTRSFF